MGAMCAALGCGRSLRTTARGDYSAVSPIEWRAISLNPGTACPNMAGADARTSATATFRRIAARRGGHDQGTHATRTHWSSGSDYPGHPLILWLEDLQWS